MIHPALIRKQRIIMMLLTVLILGTVVIGMGLGDAPLPYNKVFPTLLAKGILQMSSFFFNSTSANYHYSFSRNGSSFIRRYLTRCYAQ